MSVNFSSPSNSIPIYCFDSTVTIAIGIGLTITKAFLLLPLSILVLCLGHQRWWQQRSFATTSHSNFFTLHLAAMELMWFLGSVCFYCGSSINLSEMINAGFWLQYLTHCGEGFFHALTCVDRYLAVVHPVTYLGLRNARGARIRNISTGCVWLLSFGTTCAITLHDETLVSSISFFFILGASFIVVSFCSLSVLCVLIRPGPGEGGQDRRRVDPSKQRAFHTVMAITGVVWLWIVALIVFSALNATPLVSATSSCVALLCSLWFNLPSSLVLPLLYLHRAGKLACCSFKSG